jgi:hypothetical protein
MGRRHVKRSSQGLRDGMGKSKKRNFVREVARKVQEADTIVNNWYMSLGVLHDGGKEITMQRFWQVAVLYSVIALGGVLVTSTASATAIGAEPVGGFEMETPAGVTVRVPECQLNHEIHGSGKKITHQIAYLGCAVPQFSLCNWRIDFHYADTNGKTYKIDKGRTHTAATSPPNARSRRTAH